MEFKPSRTCFVVVLVTILIINMSFNAVTYGFDNDGYVNVELYMIDYIFTMEVKGDVEIYFDIPVNYSDNSLTQYSYIVETGGNVEVIGNNNVEVKYSMFNGSYGYVIVKVNVKYINITNFIMNIENNPLMFKEYEDDVPRDVRSNYIGKPNRLVVDIVKGEFEAWLNRSGYSVVNASKAFIAFQAANFIYKHFISYNASAIPRTLEDVVEMRVGDCDDMSRVLLNLLWCYGVPAKIEYGYVYVPLNITLPVRRAHVIFKDNGPHAYVVAYIPPIGWVSLDLLAGARIFRPVLVTGYTVQGEVKREAIEGFIEFHEEHAYIEYVAVYSKPKSYNEMVSEAENTILKQLNMTELPISCKIKTLTTHFQKAMYYYRMMLAIILAILIVIAIVLVLVKK